MIEKQEKRATKKQPPHVWTDIEESFDRVQCGCTKLHMDIGSFRNEANKSLFLISIFLRVLLCCLLPNTITFTLYCLSLRLITKRANIYVVLLFLARLTVEKIARQTKD